VARNHGAQSDRLLGCFLIHAPELMVCG
jgi:hypothetical protein